MNASTVFAHILVTLTLRVIPPAKVGSTPNLVLTSQGLFGWNRIRAARNLHACEEIEVLGVARKITETKPEYQPD
jgi:hypothetical protein